MFRFQYLLSLIMAAQRCVDTLCIDGLSVLVHCSDGWDRTSQLTSCESRWSSRSWSHVAHLAVTKLIADPFYRTFEGFEQLITREWVEFGHKFSDRNGMLGNVDNNERSPVCLQFLDAVHQLWLRNPDCFEFNQRYLARRVTTKASISS